MLEDPKLHELAERQHGVVAVRQVDPGSAHQLALAPRWERVTATVFRLRGSPPGWQQRLMIGLLDAGAGALVSHRSAAKLWRLPGFDEAVIEVTRGGRLKSHVDDAVRLHRPRLLLPHHRTELFDFPITSIARTIFDLAAAGVPMGRLAALIDEVSKRSPATLVALHRMLGELAAKGRPGITVMRVLLDERPPATRVTESNLERRFETILRHAGQAPLARQVDLGGHDWIGRVDFLDRSLLLIAEVDSALHHTSPADVARDRRRDDALLAAGFRKVVRVPEEHIWHEPWKAVDAIRTARAELRTRAA